MIASIVGWYGTDTLGDRAILDGIISIIAHMNSENEIRIGSLFDFYSKRALFEDKEIYKQYGAEIKYNIFDIKCQSEMRKNVISSDILILGGGPLMDLEELYIIRKSFLYAKKCGIPIIILGCGIGPLNNKKYIEVVKEILTMADEVLLRDEISYEIAKKLIGKNKKIKVIGDPAIISIENYRNQYKSYREDYVAINFREYTSSEYGSNCYYDIEFARKVVNTIRNKFEKVLLVPMHTFAIGGDDRKHLSEIVFNQNYDNAYVLHEPMNIYELYKIYLNAKACIGMRYHSIVMQTILNGNNFILDYTNVKTGKINGFINMLKNNKFYGDRIIHLQQPITKDKYELLHNICLNERYDYVNSNINKDYIDIMLPYVKGESFVKNEE